MRPPSRRGPISRTIVSTSGSSGTLDLAPRDVAPPGPALEGNPICGAAACLRGERHRLPDTGDVQHAATGAAEFSLIVAVGAGVKNEDVLPQLRVVGQPDRDPLFRIVGIP